MPQAIDITVNNGTSTPVAKTFELLEPAASGGSSAKWALKEGDNWNTFSKVEASSRPNAQKNAQKLQLTYSFPATYVDTASGLTLVKDQATQR